MISDPQPVPEVLPAPGNKSDWIPLLLRLVVFIVIEVVGLVVFSMLLLPFGYLSNATLSVLLAAVCGNFLCLRIYENTHLAAVGFPWNPSSRWNLFFGLLAGAGAALCVTLLPVLAGGAEFRLAEEPFAWSTLAYAGVLLLFGATGEEIFFRGYGFQILLNRFGPWVVIAPVAIVFAALHAQNPNASRLGLANTALWGVVLGYAFWRSGDLWLPTGLHFAWNFTLPLLGANLSGFTMKLSGYSLYWKTGPLISGGDYGPEAGLLTTLVGMAVLLLVWRAPIRRQRPFLLSARWEE